MLNMPLEHKIAQEYSDFMAASIAGYEKVNKSPGTSLSQESHAGPLKGQTPVGVNGEGRHGLIIPLSSASPGHRLPGWTLSTLPRCLGVTLWRVSPRE